MSNITNFQRYCLMALSKTPDDRTTAKTITFRMGLFNSGRISVISAMRSLTRRGYAIEYEVGGGIPYYPSITWTLSEKAKEWLSKQTSA
jgi:hypothetical protein